MLSISIIAFNASISGYNDRTEKKLIEAIEDSELSRVKALLEKEAKKITSAQKEKLLEVASKIERTKNRERGKVITILKHRSDLGPFVIGSFALGIGVIKIACGENSNGLVNKILAIPTFIGWTLVAGTGAYYAKKGWDCPAAEAECRAAETIEKFIEGIKVEDKADALPQ